MVGQLWFFGRTVAYVFFKILPLYILLTGKVFPMVSMKCRTKKSNGNDLHNITEFMY